MIRRARDEDSSRLMTSAERMRARCTVPRDPSAVYEMLRKMGLQYGPAFRLLTDIHIPESALRAAPAH